MSSTSAASFYKNTKSHTVFSHNILICQYNGGSVVYICILNIFNLFQSVRSFVRLLVRGIKNGHLIGRRNEVTANMAALAVYMCLAASRLLDTLRASVCMYMHKVRIHSYVHVNKYALGARTCTYKNRYVWYKHHIMHPCHLLYRIQ